MRKYFSLLAILSIVVSGCTKEGEESSGSSGNQGSQGSNTSATGAFRTECGTVVGGVLTNPASPKDGFRSAVTVLGPNLLSIRLENGPLLVKLHALGTPFNKDVAASAKRTLESLAAEGEGVFSPANADCTTTVSGGGVGSIGQMFTASGKSYTEALFSRGLARAASDPCGGSLLSACYNALQDEAESKFAGEIGRFLWKPVSDSDGLLAIHTGPSGTTVVVNGETGVNKGGGNGYGSLARFSKTGCGYGGSARVQIFNSRGAAYTFNGSTTITIPNGCNRYCLNGSTFEQCVKR